MALIKLREVYEYQGNQQYEQYTDYFYNLRKWEFDTSAKTVSVTDIPFTTNEPGSLEDYSRPPGEIFFTECLPGTTTRRDYYHNGSGGFTVQDTPKSAFCGYAALVLAATVVKHPDTKISRDGAVSLSATGGTKPYQFRRLPDGLWVSTSSWGELKEGVYNFGVRDADGLTDTAEVTLTGISQEPVPGCKDPRATNYEPDADIADNTLCEYQPAAFFIPMMNSLRFVVPTLPGELPNFDNQLFCQSAPAGFRPLRYFQKVVKGDQITIQFISNFQQVAVRVFNSVTNSQVAALATEEADAGQNVKEFVWDTSALPEGVYHLAIEATDEIYGSRSAVSEPVDLRAEHPGTALIEYYNIDNAYDLAYSTGIKNRVRVEARFYQRRPADERSTYRDSKGKLINLSADNYRKVQFDTLQLPEWLHEKLAVAFSHDRVMVNSVAYQAEEGYEHEPIARYLLSNGSILLEQVGWFGKHNRHDTGSEGGSGDPVTILNADGTLYGVFQPGSTVTLPPVLVLDGIRLLENGEYRKSEG
ncbi:hypothetical protein [Rufibacter quisquiliarum]|uniref:Uncharacterized protein n=1 Tax=Rufibacter quisquiliarum TaxID=1549639 RepID=A0A839GV79_9BACT|nr:hypothetical protein [Rufibacter quisquiliarum]MBA9078338.1 hypothetical protein [Rufibacter quisquiliarum]